MELLLMGGDAMRLHVEREWGWDQESENMNRNECRGGSSRVPTMFVQCKSLHYDFSQTFL